jgi:hypothetical protein
VRIFKNKWFKRWARKENVSDDVLVEATKEIEAGKVDADLGGFIFKKRLAKPESGKSGGYRVLVGYKKGSRTVFLYAFAKNQKSNISDEEKTVLKVLAKEFLAATPKGIKKLKEQGSLWEVKDE